METFQFSVETKHTIWYQSFVDIEAETLEEAIQKARELGPDELYVQSEYAEPIYESLEDLTPADNDGQSTQEIRCLETDKIIWDNVEGNQ